MTPPRSRLKVLVGIALWAAWATATPAEAHRPSDSTLTLRPWESEGRWDIAVRDLHHAVDIDENGDGAITWGEIRNRQLAIAQYASERLSLANEHGSCQTAVNGLQIVLHADGPYASLALHLTCPPHARKVSIEYRLLFEKDPQHRGIARVIANGEHTLLFSPSTPLHTVTLGLNVGWVQPVLGFVGEGIWHIFIGLDHILFLLALLLPSVFLREAGQMIPVQTLRQALPDVVRIVTAFTLAHSLTLGIATLGVLQVPTRLAEATIAITVVLAGIHNLWPTLGKNRWVMAFALGLVHGFGFSRVLSDLDLPPGQLVSTLLGFNLGVELGQLAMVLAFLPIAFAVRRTIAYRRFIFVGGSLAVIAMGAIWFLERTFNLTLVANFSTAIARMT